MMGRRRVNTPSALKLDMISPVCFWQYQLRSVCVRTCLQCRTCGEYLEFLILPLLKENKKKRKRKS